MLVRLTDQVLTHLEQRSISLKCRESNVVHDHKSMPHIFSIVCAQVSNGDK